MKKNKTKSGMSLSVMMTSVVVVLMLILLLCVLLFFIRLYESSIEQNTITSSEQATRQVVNTVENYVEDMAENMRLVAGHMGDEPAERDEFLENFMEVRPDVVAVMTYDTTGVLKECWSNGHTRKEQPLEDLSYGELETVQDLQISKPHVESLLEDYYPWVVTISKMVVNQEGRMEQAFMDIRFSGIANYVDDVGIGQHGYCFIVDTEGNLIYHPQQQMIYAGLKEETGEFAGLDDGFYMESNVIYTVQTLTNCNWRVVGVSYVDELITTKVAHMVKICVTLLLLVLVTAILVGSFFSWMLAKPVKRLTGAMEEFEKNTENFRFEPVEGAGEITSLSASFGHMVLRIQYLMEKVRQEEISLRKTELKALQAQINPHFLYNTLDSIAWMCEEERPKEAVEMVNALARLFRISISKGHELISLEKELEHAKSYLKIQNFRYKNQFTYEFDVEESCLPYLCNKITLQPMIENAIYHGLNRMVDEGKIRITVREEENAVVMTVEDNGVGMTEETCREILRREPGERTGIGIKNVNDRIQIYFGEEYGIRIASEPDVGTLVEIRIPKLREGEYDIK